MRRVRAQFVTQGRGCATTFVAECQQCHDSPETRLWHADRN